MQFENSKFSNDAIAVMQQNVMQLQKTVKNVATPAKTIQQLSDMLENSDVDITINGNNSASLMLNLDRFHGKSSTPVSTNDNNITIGFDSENKIILNANPILADEVVELFDTSGDIHVDTAEHSKITQTIIPSESLMTKLFANIDDTITDGNTTVNITSENKMILKSTITPEDVQTLTTETGDYEANKNDIVTSIDENKLVLTIVPSEPLVTRLFSDDGNVNVTTDGDDKIVLNYVPTGFADFINAASANMFYVSSAGDNTNEGTIDKPVKTLTGDIDGKTNVQIDGETISVTPLEFSNDVKIVGVNGAKITNEITINDTTNKITFEKITFDEPITITRDYTITSDVFTTEFNNIEFINCEINGVIVTGEATIDGTTGDYSLTSEVVSGINFNNCEMNGEIIANELTNCKVNANESIIVFGNVSNCEIASPGGSLFVGKSLRNSTVVAGDEVGTDTAPDGFNVVHGGCGETSGEIGGCVSVKGSIVSCEITTGAGGDNGGSGGVYCNGDIISTTINIGNGGNNSGCGGAGKGEDGTGVEVVGRISNCTINFGSTTGGACGGNVNGHIGKAVCCNTIEKTTIYCGTGEDPLAITNRTNSKISYTDVNIIGIIESEKFINTAIRIGTESTPDPTVNITNCNLQAGDDQSIESVGVYSTSTYVLTKNMVYMEAAVTGGDKIKEALRNAEYRNAIATNN